MSELTPAEALGRGVAFGNLWDFEVRAGSIGDVDGYDVLGRDLAFGTIRELDSIRGERVDADLAEDVAIAVRRVANRDGRVRRIVEPIDVRAADDRDDATVEVDLTVVAATGERGEYVLPL